MATIHRHKKDRDFVTLDTHCLRNPKLKLAEKGLHSYLMQLPADWKINVADLATRSDDGKDYIAKLLNLLIKAGYVLRVKVKGQRGRFSGYEYHVFERPEYREEFTVSALAGYGATVSGQSITSKVLSEVNIKEETGQDFTASRKKKSPSARNQILLPVEALPFMELAKEIIGFMAGSPADHYLSTVWLDYKERGHEVALYQSLLAYRKVRAHRGLGSHSYQKLVPEIMENTDYQALWSQIVKDNPKLYPDVVAEDPTDEQIAYKQFLASLPDKSQQ